MLIFTPLISALYADVSLVMLMFMPFTMLSFFFSRHFRCFRHDLPMPPRAALRCHFRHAMPLSLIITPPCHAADYAADAIITIDAAFSLTLFFCYIIRHAAALSLFIDVTPLLLLLFVFRVTP